MGETFYVVQQLINNRAGVLPSKFSSKTDAVKFINMLDAIRNPNVKTEIHLYEVKEITY